MTVKRVRTGVEETKHQISLYEKRRRAAEVRKKREELFPLTYANCEKLLNGKPQFKIGRLALLERRGRSFVFKIPDGHIYATLRKDDVATLRFSVLQAEATNAPPYWFWRLFCFRCASDPLKSAGIQYRGFFWRRGMNYDRSARSLCIDGLQLDLRRHVVLNAPTELKCRHVDPAKAKPIRDKIADWERLAKSYFAMHGEWTVNAAIPYRDAKACFPLPDEEPSVPGLLGLLKMGAARRWWVSACLENPPTTAAWRKKPDIYGTFMVGFEK